MSRKQMVILLMTILVIVLVACGKKWKCDVCAKEWSGEAYYMAYGGPDSTLCEDCAWAYYNPVPYGNFVKK